MTIQANASARETNSAQGIVPTYLTPKQTAELLAISVTTVRRAIKAGTLPAVKIGTAVRINANDLDNLLTPMGGEAK